MQPPFWGAACAAGSACEAFPPAKRATHCNCNIFHLSFQVMSAPLLPAPEAGTVLTKAVLRAAELLALKHRELAAILGISEASISRLGSTRRINPGGKEGELALLFLRFYRSLDALVGGNTETARRWIHSPNDHLGGVPAQRIRRAEGLIDAVQYLDAMRGRL